MIFQCMSHRQGWLEVVRRLWFGDMTFMAPTLEGPMSW